MVLSLPVLIVLGVVLGAGFVVVFGRWAGGGHEDTVYAVGLAAAAFIYLLFATGSGAGTVVAVEAAGFVGFSGLALRAMRRRAAGLLALGWLLHTGWDGLVHLALAPGTAPAAYPPLCLGFDLAVAAYLAARIATLLPDPPDK